MPYSALAPHPYFQAAGATVSGTGPVSPAWPTHLAGDIALLICESSGGEAVTLSTPAGFAEIAAGDALHGLNPSPADYVAGGTRLTVFWCRATSAAMASPTVADPGDHIVAKILTFRNCIDSGSPFGGFNFTASRTSGTSFTATQGPTDVENCILVGVATTNNSGVSSAIFSGWDSSSLLGGGTMTEIADSRVADGNGGGIGAAWGYLGPAGGQGSMTYTISGAGFSARACIYLKPNPPPSVPIDTDKGHILDGNTILYWGMDEEVGDNRGSAENEHVANNGMATAASSGIPGYCDYTPIPGKYARRFIASPHAVTSGLALDAALSTIDGGTAAVTIGSWTWEMFLRLDTLAIAQNILGVQGATSETAANNFLGRLTVLASGLMQMFWESGLGTDHTITQVNGTPLVAGTWYHIAITKDAVAKNVEFWVDGVLQDTVAYTTNPDTGTSCLQLVGKNGTTANSGNFGTFSLRQWHFSKVVRSGAYIAANAAKKATTGWMISDDNTHQNHGIGCSALPCVLDSSGNQLHGLSEGSSATVNITRPSAFGGLIRDNGRARMTVNCDVKAHYNAAVNAALIDTFTVEMWLVANLPAALANINQGFFCHGDPGDESQAGNYISAGVTANGAVFFQAEHGAGSNTDADITSAPGVFPFGVLTHVAVRGRKYGTVYGDGGSTRMEAQIFINGVQVLSGDILKPDGSNSSVISYFKVNHKNSGASEGNAVIDNVRVSNVRRTDAEILESYERGAAANGDGLGPVVSNLTPANATELSTFQTIAFDIDDADGIKDVIITCRLDGEADPLLVHDDAGFHGRWAARSSVADTILDGPLVLQKHFVIAPVGGWYKAPVALKINGYDIFGWKEGVDV